MASTTGNAPKKEKVKRQTPEERLESIRYNQMMYGPTAGEMRPVTKKINLGTAYLGHPKFQALMSAFKKGTSFQFNVTDKEKVYIVSTDGTHISFDGKTIYYSRTSNKYENMLLMDRQTTLQYQTVDALVHLAAAVLRSLPELGAPQLYIVNQQLYYGTEALETGIAEHGANLLIGSFKHSAAPEKAKK
jgi:hypothetical protein